MLSKRATVARPQPGARTYTLVASTEGLDRDRDTIRASGWKLDSFMRNPVILLGHDQKSPPVARAVDVDVKDGQLVVEIEFPPVGAYPAADMARTLVEQGFLRGASVGFNPLRSKPNDHGGKDYLETELLEVSLVGIPSNPSALLAAKAQGIARPAVFKSWLSGGRSQSLDDVLTDFARTLPARRSRSLDSRFIEAVRVAVNVPRKSWRSTLAEGMARVAREAARLGATSAEAREAVEVFARRAERERWAQPFPGTGMTVGEVEQLAHNAAWQHAHALLNMPSGEPYRPPDWQGV